ncbi:LysR family transcriptional regulator [Sphingomonas sp. FARSPH]|nr:LysR family transcriptional regulator [Sphingomonas sp. FARSPH]
MTVDIDYNLDGLKLHDLRCFDAVVRMGSFQAAAARLGRSHPSVFTAVGRLEARLGLALLDRGGYRVALTEAGRVLHARVTATLRDAAALGAQARLLAGGAEASLRIVIGDLCPRAPVFDLLSSFFARVPATQLRLDYEAIGGPFERLRNGEADIIFHRAESELAGIERIPMMDVELIPVAAPGFLPASADGNIPPDHLHRSTQCVIRDSARAAQGGDYFLLDGVNRCSVPDHAMKRELILYGLAWGHLPDFMVRDDLTSGRLVRIKAPHLPRHVETVTASRCSGGIHGPVAERLWQCIIATYGAK